jgi:hypothetical protein
MKIYIGKLWIPFPSSEYGGMWAVIANNNEECVELLKKDGNSWYPEYNELIPASVEEAWALVLHPDYDKHGQKPGILKPEIIETFFT